MNIQRTPSPLLLPLSKFERGWREKYLKTFQKETIAATAAKIADSIIKSLNREVFRETKKYYGSHEPPAFQGSKLKADERESFCVKIRDIIHRQLTTFFEPAVFLQERRIEFSFPLGLFQDGVNLAFARYDFPIAVANEINLAEALSNTVHFVFEPKDLKGNFSLKKIS